MVKLLHFEWGTPDLQNPTPNSGAIPGCPVLNSSASISTASSASAAATANTMATNVLLEVDATLAQEPKEGGTKRLRFFGAALFYSSGTASRSMCVWHVCMCMCVWQWWGKVAGGVMVWGWGGWVLICPPKMLRVCNCVHTNAHLLGNFDPLLFLLMVILPLKWIYSRKASNRRAFQEQNCPLTGFQSTALCKVGPMAILILKHRLWPRPTSLFLTPATAPSQ